VKQSRKRKGLELRTSSNENIGHPAFKRGVRKEKIPNPHPNAEADAVAIRHVENIGFRASL
jgi:hypothetical protein